MCERNVPTTRLLERESGQCTERTQTLEPGAWHIAGAQAVWVCLLASKPQSQPGPELPIPLPELTGAGSETVLHHGEEDSWYYLPL